MSYVMLIGVLWFSITSGSQDTAKLNEQVQGSWVLTTAGGQPVPAGVHKAIVVTGDKYKGLTNGAVDEAGSFKLDAGVTPAAVDLVISEGTSAGKTQLGTVAVTGDTMTLTLAEPGATRPAAGSTANA